MLKTHIWRVVGFGIAGLLLGLGIGIFSPKVYEAQTEMLLGESPITGGQSILDPTVVRILQSGSAQDAQTELQLVRSQTVFFTALRNVADAERKPDLLVDWVKYFLMYDVISSEQRAGVLEMGSVASVRVRMYDAKLAAKVAQEITSVYNEMRLDNARNGSSNAIRFLDGQVKSAKTTLDNTEEAYRKEMTTAKIVDPQTTTTMLNSLVNGIRTQLSNAQAAYAGAVSQSSSLQASLANVPKTIGGTALEGRPELLRNYESQAATLSSQLAGLRQRYYEDAPQVQEVKKQLEDLHAKIASAKKGGMEDIQTGTTPNPVYQNLQSTLQNAVAQRDSLAQQVSSLQRDMSELEAQLATLPETDAKIRTLRRDLEVADANYRRVKMQYDDVKNRVETGARSAVVLSEARAFPEPVAPDIPKFVMIGCIAGICIGLIFSLSLESLRVRVHNSAELAELTGLPVAATVPILRGHSQAAAAFAKPGARPGESFRHMAYSLLAKKGADAPKLVMFTSVGAIPGRASSALQFAAAMAGTGTRVLLVDADPMRGTITKAFGMEGKSGVSEIFERTSLPGENSDLFMPTVHENLTLLPAGVDTTRTLADHTNSQIEAFVKFLSDKAEMIVIDTPPCDLFSDASRVASFADEVCMVLSARQTNYQSIPTGYDILTRAGAKNVSLILTDASPSDEPFSDARSYVRNA